VQIILSRLLMFRVLQNMFTLLTH